ncbi:MAG: hypothetical protein D6796_07105 [Caldilineae bacterium]|nr:MAG: hypothetical protein D6796_07105 [Caldilineae bacterium]
MKNVLTTWRDNPVIVNELRSRMRGRRAFLVLAGHLLVVGGLVTLIYLILYEQMNAFDPFGGGGFQNMLEASSMMGKGIFYTTTFLLLLIASLVGPAFSASSIVSEKDRQTFDLLLITALSPRAIVLGKLSAILIFMGLLILATLPFQTMAYFFGGVALAEVAVAALVLLATTLFFCSLGLFISTIARSTTIANMVTYAAVIPFLLGVPFLFFLIGILTSGNFFEHLFDNPSRLAGGILVYGILFFLSINPLSMALTTEIFIQETGKYFYSVEQFFNHRYPIVAPWLIYLLFCLGMSLFLVRAAIRRVGKVSKT